MKFRQYGYVEKNVQVREMTMGAIILTIAQGAIKNNIKDIEIRIVDCYSAEVNVYKGLDELLSNDWNADWKVNVYDWCVMHNTNAETSYMKVIIADEVEMME